MSESTAPKSNLLNVKEAAKYLDTVTYRTLDRWRSQGIGPKFVKIGRHIRYKIADLEEFIEESTVANVG